jgi:hypothetical protein
LENIITISIGAVMSRAIVGESDFVPVVVCCFVIVLLHGGIGWLIASSKPFRRFIEGEKILLYEKDDKCLQDGHALLQDPVDSLHILLLNRVVFSELRRLVKQLVRLAVRTVIGFQELHAASQKIAAARFPHPSSPIWFLPVSV